MYSINLLVLSLCVANCVSLLFYNVNIVIRFNLVLYPMIINIPGPIIINFIVLYYYYYIIILYILMLYYNILYNMYNSYMYYVYINI